MGVPDFRGCQISCDNSDNLHLSAAIFLPRQDSAELYGTTGQVDSPPCTIPTSVVVLPVALNLSCNVVKTMLQNLLNIISLTILRHLWALTTVLN